MHNSSLLFWIILTIFVACSSACNPTPQDSNQNTHPYPFVTDEEDGQYPEYQDPYPFPSKSTATLQETTQRLFEEIPSPSPTNGVVTGFLLQPGNNAEPYLAEIYLGRTIEAQQPGYEPMIGFSRDTDPAAVQDPETGEFYFSDVPPGNYALIVWNPISSYMFRNHATDGFLIFEVRPGEVIDLGVLRMP